MMLHPSRPLRLMHIGLAILAAGSTLLAACSSSSSSNPGGSSGGGSSSSSGGGGPAQASGKVYDGPIVGATVDAYSLSSAGVPSASPIASATTKADGTYSMTLPQGFSGNVLLQTIGGTFVDDTTGQTVAAPVLSALVPNASGTFTAQLTPLSSLSAQLSLQVAQAAGVDPGQIGITLNAAVAQYFGGLGDILGTPLVDVTTAGCATSASQASVDASLVVTALSKLAAQNGVTTTALVDALVWDYVSDFTFDGLNNGSPISVPRASGSGSVNLCAIEGNCPGGSGGGFQQAIAAAIAAWTASSANLCAVQLSTATTTALSTLSAFTPNPPAPGALPITLNGSISGLPSGSTLTLLLGAGGVGRCTTATLCVQATYRLVGGTGSGTVSFSGTAGAPLASITDWTLTLPDYGLAAGSDTQCTLNSVRTGAVPPNATALTINGVSISCAPRVYPVNGVVYGLQSGQSVVLQDEGADTLPLSGNGFFTFATQLTLGSAYSASILTQPATGGPCVLSGGDNGLGAGTIHDVAGGFSQVPTALVVNCGAVALPTLNNPNGLAFANNLLYLANAGANQVLIFSETLNAANQVTGLTPLGAITQDISNPTRLAFDPAGRYLYVTNIGTGTGSVTVYDTANNNLEVTASKITGGSINRPLGISVDRSGNVYVAENSGNAISVFQPKSGGGYAEASFSPVSTDAAGNSYAAPGAMAFYSVSYGDLLFIGTGAGDVLLYLAPFTNASKPLYTLAAAGCSTAPTGPTAFAMHVGGISGGPSSDSTLWVANFYAGDVLGYDFAEFFSASACPAPLTPYSTVAGSNGSPEGLLIDPFGNLIVVNASTNHLLVYSGPLTGAPTFTY